MARFDNWAEPCYLNALESSVKRYRMDPRISWIRLFSLGIFMITIMAPNSLTAQFEQKLSLNISAGYFNTVGWSGWEENWEDHGPSLMPNFKGGPSILAGLQYNFNRHFSIEFQLGYSFSLGWYFDASNDNEEAYNYLYYEIYDAASATILATGENYMDMKNLHLGIAPRYYFAPGNRFNPFVFAGVSLNYTDAYFENNEYQACEELGRLDLYEENSELVNWFEYQVGIGLMAGLGVEYSLNDNWGLFAMASYHFIALQDQAFYKGNFLVNYHDIGINLGTRISILKSKEL